jgi:hypothetical protein
MQSSRAFIATALLAAAITSVSAKTKFESVWKSPDAATISFAGAKVAALIIDKDDSLRMAGEEALVRELDARGMKGVASYRMVPKEVLLDADRARPWYEKAGVQGVVALRVVNDDRRKTIVPSTWTSTYYESLWGYYSYGWGVTFSPGYTRDERVLSLETLVFSVPKNRLMWAGLSVTDNPKDGAKVIAEVVKEAVNEMRKQGLAKKTASAGGIGETGYPSFMLSRIQVR